MKLLRMLLSVVLVFAFCPLAYADDLTDASSPLPSVDSSLGAPFTGDGSTDASGGGFSSSPSGSNDNAASGETAKSAEHGVSAGGSSSGEVLASSADADSGKGIDVGGYSNDAVIAGEDDAGEDGSDSVVDDDEEDGECALDDLAAEYASCVADGSYAVCSGLGSRQVLDVKSASTANGANVQTYASNGTKAQVWEVSHDAEGYVTLTCAVSGKCLDVAGAKVANGANVIQYESNGTKAQKWIAIPQGNGFKLVSALDESMCLDVANGKAESGTNVQIYPDNGTAAQTFSFVAVDCKVSPCDDFGLSGWYGIASVLDNSFVFDVQSASVADGANMQLYKSNGTLAQLFGFEYDANLGYYRIVSAVSGKYLEIAGGDPVEGAKTQQWASRSNDTRQMFSLVKSEGDVGSEYSFVNVASGLALSIDGGKAASKASILGFRHLDADSQKFVLVENSALLVDGVYSISSALSSSKVLDVKSASVANGANVQIYETNSTFAQKWWVSGVDGQKNIYLIQSLCSGLYLTADESGNVCQRSLSGKGNQHWELTLAAGTFVLKNVASGKVLDVASAKTANGTNVQTYVANGTGAQKFVFKSVVPVADGTYAVHFASSPGYVLDVKSASSSNGANIQLYSSNGTGAQKWKVGRNADGTYTFRNAANGKALDVKSASAVAGANVQQYTSNATAAQKWRIVWNPKKAAFTVVSALDSSLVLGSAGSASNGRNVQLCTKDSNSALQGWTFEKTTYQALSSDQLAMSNKAQGYSSSTKWLILVNNKTNKVGIFSGSKGKWELKYYWTCSTGASSTPTVMGQYTVGIKGYSFGDGYSCYYYTQFYGDYLFHSVLYYQGTKKIMDGTLGKNVSHGCVRLSLSNAKWIYDNIPRGTKVVSYKY